MKKKRYTVKLFVQLIICIVVIITVIIMKNSGNALVSKYYDKICEMACYNITVSDIESMSAKAVSKIKGTPSRLVSTVIQVSKASQYGVPIDENNVTETVKQVHSVAGGVVKSVGKNSENGLFVEIKHEDAVSTYGQLEDVKVVPNERVQRGEIVGSYDPKCGSEFYYQLTPNV